ncbi:phosphoglycerate dehydrogenase [Neomoorella thermoacetica]|uniref:phosphoglycerate dehydrogenase n=1 Tax=Neomoorella thermoacetica TaxID=1525 RepID=UPI0008FA07F3|nr:phosphoglycerate dehydrogenase [Moorella thermoacetica]OIQ11084.1 hydroxypyruvate reductase [Moorella thermoacetica]
MGYKVVVTPRSFGATSTRPLEMLREKGYEVVLNLQGRPLKQEELLELAANADGLLVGIDEVSRQVIEGSPGLKAISKYGVGVDNIDLQAARERGIIVTNTPGVNTEAVADLAVALMLCTARQVAAADYSIRKGEWKKFMGVSLFKKTVGILGTGQIGRAVARRLKGFEADLLLYDIARDEEFAAAVGGRYAALAEVLQEADFVTVHLPLLPTTRNLIGKAELRLMKASAIIVNTARGGIIEETALVKALREKWIRGAALDTFSVEPLANEELRKLPNVVLTPHIGAYTEEAVLMMGMQAARNLIDALEGRRPESVVS